VAFALPNLRAPPPSALDTRLASTHRSRYRATAVSLLCIASPKTHCYTTSYISTSHSASIHQNTIVPRISSFILFLLAGPHFLFLFKNTSSQPWFLPSFVALMIPVVKLLPHFFCQSKTGDDDDVSFIYLYTLCSHVCCFAILFDEYFLFGDAVASPFFHRPAIVVIISIKSSVIRGSRGPLFSITTLRRVYAIYFCKRTNPIFGRAICIYRRSAVQE